MFDKFSIIILQGFLTDRPLQEDQTDWLIEGLQLSSFLRKHFNVGQALFFKYDQRD